MKILFIIPSFSHGGQEKAGMILCNYLMRYHHVLALCFKPQSTSDYDYKCDVVRIILPDKYGLAARISGLIKKVQQTKKIKKTFQPDVSIAFGDNAIVINYFTGSKEVKIASLRHSFKNSMLAETIAEKMYDKLYKFSLKKADKIVPVSNEINKELKKILSIENTLFVNNGYDLSDIALKANRIVPSNLASFFNDKVIAHTGRFDATKCHFQLVKFFGLVKERDNSAKLMLIGGIDPSRQENTRIYEFCISYLLKRGYKIIYTSKKYTDDEVSNADILITGHQSNPFCYLSKAALFVFPSVLEGFPNALMEAMACSLPVVSSNCPTGPTEILRDDFTDENFGILLPFFDHKYNLQDEGVNENHVLWATTIIELMQNKKRLNKLRNQSNKRVQQFTVDIVCKKWLDILTTIKV